MLLVDALNFIIDDGIESARHDYATPRHFLKRAGAVAGFEERRNRKPAQIAALFVAANERASQAIREEDPRYQFWRCRALEIGWVANVLSNILVVNGELPITTMTARGRTLVTLGMTARFYLGWYVTRTLAMAVATVVLIALLSESMRLYAEVSWANLKTLEHEAAVMESEARLQEALAAGAIMAFEWDAITGLMKRSLGQNSVVRCGWRNEQGERCLRP